jgi:hydrogenase-4 component F
MAVAGLFMIGQRDFKRMLAYSSVEHMGILMIGLGIGGPALFGTLLHVVTNGATKGVLFLSAGNIHRAYASKSTEQVRGALRRLPLSAGLFLAAFLAITGSPPFGPFVSEFAILNGAFATGRFGLAAAFLVFLFVVFVGMGRTVLKVVQGRAPAEILAALGRGGDVVGASSGSPGEPPPFRDGFLTTAPIVLLMIIVLVLGLWIPGPLSALIGEAVGAMGGLP